jgi:calcium-translocating P-type ATPase
MYELRGLTPKEIEHSKRKFGTNALTEHKKQSFMHKFFESFGDPIIKILLVALALNIIFTFKNANWFETVGIAIAVFLATFVSTLSEYGSESAFIRLQEEAAKIKCRVKRNGAVTQIPLAEVVVGDLVLLQAGERIPADGKLISGSLSVDQSALNGESKEAQKSVGADDGKASSPLLEKSRLFRGSIVCAGEGIMQTEAVGEASFYGKLAVEIQEKTAESPLKLRVRTLAEQISRLGYIAAAVVILANLFFHVFLENGFDPVRISLYFADKSRLFGDLLQAVTLAITVLVMAVPEGLPMMITVVLSSNMRRMLKDNVLVRKLTGIETSGSLNILFTDKTGTLTAGKLELTGVMDGTGQEHTLRALASESELFELFALSGVYNSGSQRTVQNGRAVAIGGNATDRALLEAVLKHSRAIKGAQLVRSVPFDSQNKFSSAEITGQRKLIFVKGAPEKLLPHCSSYYDRHGEKRPLASQALLRKFLAESAKKSVRLLAICTADTLAKRDSDLKNLTLIGIAAIRDSIRQEAKSAVAQITRAGVQVVMITGDNKETAVAVATETGVLSSRDTADAVCTSKELAAMTDTELAARIKKLRVVARALPSDKSRLVMLAQKAGLVAGMTGDGINDAPALKRADVGFAMGNGTEVAKEAGDIVILDNNLASIAKAILYGRTIFKSIRKFVIFQLTVNLCAVGISVIGPFIGAEEPVTVMQMLWINIIMDTLAGLAFSGEAPLPEYMKEPPKRKDEKIINRYMYSQIGFTGLFSLLLCVCFLKLPVLSEHFRYGENGSYFWTAFFALFIFIGIFNSFNARTYRINIFSRLFSNWFFLLIMLAVGLVQILLIYFGGSLFRTAGLTFAELKLVLLMALSVVPIDIIRKVILRACGRKGNI